MSSTMRLGVLACMTVLGILGHGSTRGGENPQADPVIASKLADADYLRARLARVEAEIALANHLRASTKQEVETMKSEIALAESDLARANDRLDWSLKMEQKGFLVPSTVHADQLGLEKAKFSLLQAQTKKLVFETLTRNKNIEKLRIAIAKATAAELVKKAAYDRLIAKPEE